jgi:hypothetical protein
MSFFSCLRNGKRSASTVRRRTQTCPRQRASFRPQLEALEDRWLPSTLTVTTAADSPGYPYVPGSLRQEIALAQSGDTIVFDPSLSGQTIGVSGSELYIYQQLTIQGLGANNLAISGGQSRVFEVGGASVVLSGMTIEGGQPANVTLSTDGGAYDGGGIFNGGALTLNGVRVCRNSTDGNGGGIANAGTLTLTDSQVADNSAYQGGGIYNYGGTYVNGHPVPGGTVSISNSTVGMVTLPDGTILPGNTAFDGYGGGIFNPSGGTVTLSKSTVDDNTGINTDYGYGGQGGGLWNEGTMTLSGSTVTQNTSVVGGGIYNAGVMTLSGSTVSGNTSGGGIYNAGVLTLSGSTVSGNVGGIDNAGVLTLSGSTVSGNTGGGIYNDKQGNLTIESQSSVVDNTDYNLFNNHGYVKISKGSVVGK